MAARRALAVAEVTAPAPNRIASRRALGSSVEPPARLVWSDDGFADGHGKGTATVTFTEVDASTTTLTVHLVADFSETVRAGAELGWGSQLDKLADYLAA